MRNISVKCFGIDVQHYVEAIAESDLLDFEVLGYEFQFPLQRGDLEPDVFHAHSKQIAQKRHHSVCRVDIGEHERRDGMQGVEQKMRLELAPEGFQMCLCNLRLTLRRPKFPLPEPLLVPRDVCDQHNGQIAEDDVVDNVIESARCWRTAGGSLESQTRDGCGPQKRKTGTSITIA